jgi:hypothetical protein
MDGNGINNILKRLGEFLDNAYIEQISNKAEEHLSIHKWLSKLRFKARRKTSKNFPFVSLVLIDD